MRQQVLTGKFHYVRRKDKRSPERRKLWQWQCEYIEDGINVVAAVHDDSSIKPQDSELEYDFIEVVCCHESEDGKFRFIFVDVIGIHEDEEDNADDEYAENIRRALDQAERLC